MDRLARGPVGQGIPLPGGETALDGGAHGRRGGRRRYLELSALHAHLEHGGIAAELTPAAAGRGVEVVEEVVGVQGVVVEEQQSPGADAAGKRERVVDRGVAPADVLWILLVRVLAV